MFIFLSTGIIDNLTSTSASCFPITQIPKALDLMMLTFSLFQGISSSMNFDEEDDDEEEVSSSSSQLNSNTRPGSATSKKSCKVDHQSPPTQRGETWPPHIMALQQPWSLPLCTLTSNCFLSLSILSFPSRFPTWAVMSLDYNCICLVFLFVFHNGKKVTDVRF